MGHYDNCRPENCGICGQLKGYCEHTENISPEQLKLPLDTWSNYGQKDCIHIFDMVTEIEAQCRYCDRTIIVAGY